jgi:L-amino acid N-acyltransferase YncA
MKIRLATVSDLPAINEIYNQAVRKRYCTADLDEITLEQRTQWFEGHQPEEYPVFVAEENTTIIGWICFSPYRAGRRALQSAAEVSY